MISTGLFTQEKPKPGFKKMRALLVTGSISLMNVDGQHIETDGLYLISIIADGFLIYTTAYTMRANNQVRRTRKGQIELKGRRIGDNALIEPTAVHKTMRLIKLRKCWTHRADKLR